MLSQVHFSRTDACQEERFNQSSSWSILLNTGPPYRLRCLALSPCGCCFWLTPEPPASLCGKRQTPETQPTSQRVHENHGEYNTVILHDVLINHQTNSSRQTSLLPTNKRCPCGFASPTVQHTCKQKDHNYRSKHVSQTWAVCGCVLNSKSQTGHHKSPSETPAHNTQTTSCMCVTTYMT